MSCPVSVYCDRVGCHVLCLYAVMGGVSCPVSVYGQVRVSCPVSVYYDWVGCHVLCLYTDRLGCHVLCLYTVIGWGVMSCVCIRTG